MLSSDFVYKVCVKRCASIASIQKRQPKLEKTNGHLLPNRSSDIFDLQKDNISPLPVYSPTYTVAQWICFCTL